MRASRRPFVLVSLLVASTILVGGLAGCDPSSFGDEARYGDEAALTTVEGFEAGTKASYAAADVTLTTGVWHFDDALIGTLAADAKVGLKSARIRNTGRIRMQFDRAGGVGTVTLKHAAYGTDGNSNFALFWSTDGGSSWTQAGSTVTAQAGALATTTFTVDNAGPVRIELRKLTGGGNRVNLDDVTITDVGGGDPQPDAGVPDAAVPDGDPGPGPGPSPGRDVSLHTTMGLPSPASASRWDDYLSVKSEYVISFNSTRKTPNWVSWQLDSSWLGSTDRTNDFGPDPTLPAGMPQAALSDYSGTGWDRGHMCPSGDRTASIPANQQTFYLTNMIPQASNNNQGPWEKLESYSRTLVGGGRVLYVISGGVYSRTSGRIGNGVIIPDKTWKVIVVLNSRTQGPSAVTASTRVIGVVMPNNDAEVARTNDWQRYRVSVRSIEKATGLNFLSDVAPAVQDAVEMRVDNQ